MTLFGKYTRKLAYVTRISYGAYKTGFLASAKYRFNLRLVVFPKVETLNYFSTFDS